MTTQWDRIEPHTRSDELDEGLQARVADPLWMLARQWQVGELRGEDAGSPVQIHVEAVHARVETLDSLANPSPAATPEAWSSKLPLEARVEAEAVHAGPSRLALALEAGLAWLQRIDQAGFAGSRAGLRAVFPLRLTEVAMTGLPHAEQQRLRLWSRRAIDGLALLAATPQQLAAAIPDAAARQALLPHFQAWRTEQLARFVIPGPSGSCWRDDRLEYAFSLGARTGLGELVLRADDHDGARVDWWSFDVDPDKAASHGLTAKPPARRSVDLLPVPLRYAGMPASRWWEFEEGSVDFGKLAAGPTDLARLIVAEFATIYSDDWWLIPLRFPVGSLARVLELELVDSFGARHAIRSSAVTDASAGARSFALFELSGDESPSRSLAPWLLVPPALVGSLHGEDVERVTLFRDEAANLAWAIEEQIELPSGRPLRRRLQWALASGRSESAPDEPAPDEPAPSEPADADPSWLWRLQSEVPPHWIPLIPEAIAGTEQVQLRRARMLAWDQLPDPLRGLAGAQGMLLNPPPARALRLHEEELPRGGLELARHWQRARSSEGRVITWMAKRKRSGTGERGSGLRFDTITRSTSTRTKDV